MIGRDLAALAGQENVVIIRRPFVEWLGNIPDALLIDQILYWQNRAGAGEWWHLSDEEMGERLLLSKKAIAPSRDRLVSLGFIRTERKGLPYRTFYLADLDKIAKAFGEHVSSLGITSHPSADDKPSDTGCPSIEGGVKGVRKVKTQTPENPRTPTSSAAKPDNQLATPPANAVGDTEPERRRPGRPRKDRPEGGEPDGAPRWQPVVAAIMAALGRPAPSGSRLPSWLGNTVRTFGAAAGDDPARALALVGEWRQSRQLRQALDGGFVSDHRIPAMVGAWIATTRPAARTAAPAAAGLEDAQMHRLGAPSNWREFVYTHDGTRRHPSLVLPSLGLEPYARPDTWPAWYRAVEGVPA